MCVPVDPADIDLFDPHSIPTAAQLLRELDAAGEGAGWEKTSLRPYVEMLDRHTMSLMEDVRKTRRGNYNGESWVITLRSRCLTAPGQMADGDQWNVSLEICN